MGSELNRHRRRVASVGLTALGIALATTLAACGSDDADGDSAPQSGGSSSTEGLAQAQKFVADHADAPASLPSNLAALTKAPPTGMRIDVIGQNNTTSAAKVQAMKEAAEALGWTIKVYDSDSTPEGTAREMNLAVQDEPDAVIQLGFAKTTFPDAVASLQASGTPYIVTATTDEVGPDITMNVGAPADYVRRGTWLGNWVVADSKADANVAIFNLSSYPTLNNVSDAATKTINELCPKCSTNTQDVQASAIGSTLPAQIVNYLQAHPDVNYVVPTYGDMAIGVPQALAAAGLADKVKLVTQAGSITQVQDGQQAMNVPEPEQFLGYMLIDAALRALQGDDLDPEVYATLPSYFVTTENAPSDSELLMDCPVVIGDIPQQFEKLWGVS